MKDQTLRKIAYDCEQFDRRLKQLVDSFEGIKEAVLNEESKLPIEEVTEF